MRRVELLIVWFLVAFLACAAALADGAVRIPAYSITRIVWK